MPNRLNCLVLAIACSVLLCTMAAANPAPVFTDLATPNGYGHVTYTLSANTFTFTVFNDQTGSGQTIGGWAFYPTVPLYGSVPVNNGTPPTGWTSIGWEGPVTSLGPDTTGDIRDSFITSNSVFNIPPGGSQNSFSVQWTGPVLPSDIKFGLEVVRPGNTFWAQAGANPCLPVPDASTLVLAASGALMALPALRRSLRRRAVA